MENIFADLVKTELASARAKFGPQHSPHEALGVIREEYLEFEQEVFAKFQNRQNMLAELVQVAAMCQRAAEDLRLLDTIPPRYRPADGTASGVIGESCMPGGDF